MSKRIVAFAALVVTGQETDSDERAKHQSEENAFLSRARKATSDVFQFDTGWWLVSQLVEFSKSGEINDIRIHDHGFWGGIIGRGYDKGLYDNQYRTSKGDKDMLYFQASTSNFAYRVSVGQIKLADSCSITTYGCKLRLVRARIECLFGTIQPTGRFGNGSG